MQLKDLLWRVLNDYSKSGEVLDAGTSSVRDERGDTVRASGLGKCPKYAALVDHDLYKEPLTFQRWVKTEQGKWWGTIFQNALMWAERTNLGGMFSDGSTFSFEERVALKQHPKLSGKPDAIFNSQGKRIPIEFKNSVGLWESSVWQAITYMEILDAPYAHIVALNSGDGVSVNVYTIGYDIDEGGWYVLDDGIRPPRTDIKRNEFTGEMFFRYDDFNRMAAAHTEWGERARYRDSLHETPNGYTRRHPHCCKYVEPEFYKRKTVVNGHVYEPGDMKPGTGVEIPKCPLFLECWGDGTTEVDTVVETTDNDWSIT